jgi:hypothetical protein
MNTNANAAARVAGTIGAFKWVIIAVQVLAGVISMVGVNSGSGPAWMLLVVPVAVVLSVVWTWVLLGWFQHTLGMLAAVAANTAPGRPVEYGVGAGSA